MAKKVNKVISKKDKAPQNFDLLKSIKKEKAYKEDVKKRDADVRDWITENYKPKTKGTVLPGQMIMFNYFEPKTKEELEFYDAMPCCLFFNTFNTKEGEKRVLAFNIHYYPPKIRYIIVDRIFSIFKPLYMKSWDEPLKNGMSYMQYKMLMEQLEDQGLAFGVREYIPNLMHSIRPIAPKDWNKVVFTEGKFRKRTREQILNYWQTWVDKHS